MSIHSFLNKAKSLFKKHSVSVLIGGILSLLIYIPFFVNGPSRDPDAVNEVGRFRKWYAFRNGHGVWYEILDFQKYIADFNTLIKPTENPRRPHIGANYKWVIGFYWKRKKDTDREVKYSFCMIPTLVENGKVLDYFEDRRKKPAEQDYDHTYDDLKTRSSVEFVTAAGDDTLSNAFDNGHLWP